LVSKFRRTSVGTVTAVVPVDVVDVAPGVVGGKGNPVVLVDVFEVAPVDEVAVATRNARNEDCVGISSASVKPKLNARLRTCSRNAWSPSGFKSYFGSNPFVAVVKYFKPSALVKSMIAVRASPGVAYAVVVDILLADRWLVSIPLFAICSGIW
jgi:hypothetical protein